MYTGVVTKTGRPWERVNGVTGDERTWITTPGIVTLTLVHHSVLGTTFLQGPGSVLQREGGRLRGGEDPYIRILFSLRFYN